MRYLTVGSLLVLAMITAACKPTTPTKPAAAKAVQSAEPQWRHVLTDKQTSRYVTPAIQTVGPYKRTWLAMLYAKPDSYTVDGETGLVARSLHLTEFDCVETRIRDLQITVTDEKEWSTPVPLSAKNKEWIYINPDSKLMPVIRHVCHGEKLTGEGFPSLDAASGAYRKKLAGGSSAQR